MNENLKQLIMILIIVSTLTILAKIFSGKLILF